MSVSDISEAYNRYQDETYQKKCVSNELRNIGYDWECMEYGLFGSEDDMKAHLKKQREEIMAELDLIQAKLKGTKTSG